MGGADLKSRLAELGITQTEFARLIGVTPRAVTLWVTEERAIPGSADAYLRLLLSVPPNVRQVELSRLKEKGTSMRDGMYGISFHGAQDAGIGVLIFDNGRDTAPMRRVSVTTAGTYTTKPPGWQT